MSGRNWVGVEDGYGLAEGEYFLFGFGYGLDGLSWGGGLCLK